MSLTLQNRQAEAVRILDQLDDDNLPPAEQRNLRLTKSRVLAEILERIKNGFGQHSRHPAQAGV